MNAASIQGQAGEGVNIWGGGGLCGFQMGQLKANPHIASGTKNDLGFQ